MYDQLAQLIEGAPLPPDTVLGSKYLDPDYLFVKEAGFFQGLWNFVTSPDTVSAYQGLLFLLGVFFLTIIVYSIIRTFEVRTKEHAHLHHEIKEYAHLHAKKEKVLKDDEAISKNPRWRQVLHLLFSENPSDWRLSVMEADAMLEVLLGDLGFQGDSLGEKLKFSGSQGFKFLNSAWEVHTIRNRIAHEGSIFALTHHEAKRAIALYEQMFREYGYI